MTGRRDSCSSCESIGNGKCTDDRAECECFEGFSGPNCSVPTTNATQLIISDTTVSPERERSTSNIGTIVSGVLGGVLFIFVIGLIVFFFWRRRRRNRKKKLLTIPPSTTSTTPIETPPLYNISLSRSNSMVSADQTTDQHFYEDLP